MVAIALNLLAIKIKVTFHIKISWLATLQFKESRKKMRENIYMAAEKKQRKRKTRRKWWADKKTGGS